MNATRFASTSAAPASRRTSLGFVASSAALAALGSGVVFIATRLTVGRAGWAAIRSRIRGFVAIVSVDEPLPFSCTLD